MLNALSIINIVSCLSFAVPPVLPPQPPTRPLRAPSLGGAALDPAGGRLFLPGSRQVRVVDLAGRSLGVVGGLPGARAVGLAPELGIGFACTGGRGLVEIFNLATLEVEKRLRTTGGEPGSVLFEPATRRLFAFNEGGRNATAYDAFGGGVAGSIALGGRPGPAAADGAGRVFVSVGDPGAIAVLDARKLAVTQRWDLTAVEDPAGLAVDPVRQRLFLVGHDGRLAILDSGSGAVLGVLPQGPPLAGVVCDPGTGRVIVAGEDGSLRVLAGPEGGACRLEAPLATLPGVQALLLDPDSHRLYVPFVSAGRSALNVQSEPLVVPISIVEDDEVGNGGTRGALLEK